jgi:biotin transporter BioY
MGINFDHFFTPSFGFRWVWAVISTLSGVGSAVLIDIFLQSDYLVYGAMQKQNWSTDSGYTTE